MDGSTREPLGASSDHNDDRNSGETVSIGAAVVVGGGIAGMQASLDLTNTGFKVFMVESNSAIGGHMARLDKTFPSNDCAMCTISPRLVDSGQHLAKSVFQVHGSDQDGRSVVRKKLRRAQVIPFFADLAFWPIGMEACASAHYWAREL